MNTLEYAKEKKINKKQERVEETKTCLIKNFHLLCFRATKGGKINLVFYTYFSLASSQEKYENETDF